MGLEVLALASIGATAAGAGVSAYGASQAGEASSKMFNYKAGVAQVNKQIAEQNADYAVRVGETKAQRSGMETRGRLGKIRSIQGASGLDVNKGSAQRVRDSAGDLGRYDASVIRSDAAKRAYGYDVEALGYESQSNLDVMSGDQASKAGKIGAISSILGGVSSVSSKWLQGSQSGIWGGGGDRYSGMGDGP